MEIIEVSWSERRYRDILRSIRQKVFIEEQGVPAADEWDDKDDQALHFLALDGKRPVGCARLFKDGYFGRMAVLAEHRGQHWGSRLIKAMADHYQHELGGRILKASVQAQAFSFYRRNGFTPEGDFYRDAGIPHLTMTRILGREAPENHTFEAGQDDQLYQPDDPAAIEGLFQIGCQNNPRNLLLMINELNHPVWSSASSLDAIKRFIRSSSRRHIQLLINDESSGINDHPLIQLQQRISSRISLKVHSGVKNNGALFEPYAYLMINGSQVRACFNDRARVARHKEEFDDLWRSAKPAKEARRLKI